MKYYFWFRKEFIRSVMLVAEKIELVNSNYSWIVFSKENLLPSIDIPCNSEKVVFLQLSQII